MGGWSGQATCWSPLLLAELALGAQGSQDGQVGAQAVALTAPLQLLDVGQDRSNIHFIRIPEEVEKECEAEKYMQKQCLKTPKCAKEKSTGSRS